MKINSMNQNVYSIGRSITPDNRNKELDKSKCYRDTLDVGYSNNEMYQYNRSGNINDEYLNMNELSFDKGTAVDTTVTIDRVSFDKIVDYSTFNEPKWEELGVDNDKRWVVINGQRFEVPHSPEEKALRRRLSRTFVDILNDYDKENAKNHINKGKLEENSEVVKVLEKVFGTNSFEEIWNTIT